MEEIKGRDDIINYLETKNEELQHTIKSLESYNKSIKLRSV